MNCATHNDVAAVAFCRTCGKPLCANCTRSVQGVIYCEPCLAARMQGVPTAAAPVMPPPPGTPVPPSASNPALAGILSIIPGIGAVYCGQYAKGLAHMVIMGLLIAGQTVVHGAFAHIILGLGIGFFYIYQIFDAVHTANALQKGLPAPDPLGLGSNFGGGFSGVRMEGTKIPTGAIVLIILGFLFLLNTTFDWEVGKLWPLILIGLGIWQFAKRRGLAGGTYVGCRCERCMSRGLMGPAVLVTIGTQFLLDQFDVVSFARTLPALLIVIGLVKVFQSNASTTGHVDYFPPGTPGAPNMPPPQAPPSTEVNHG